MVVMARYKLRNNKAYFPQFGDSNIFGYARKMDDFGELETCTR